MTSINPPVTGDMISAASAAAIVEMSRLNADLTEVDRGFREGIEARRCVLAVFINVRNNIGSTEWPSIESVLHRPELSNAVRRDGTFL
jgi:hypothetical protein